MGTREMQDYIYFKWTNDVSARTLPVSAGLLFPPLFALSYFSTEKNEAMTREQIEKEGIDDSQIQAYIGDDCYLVEKQLSVKEIIAQTYMSPRAKFMLRFEALLFPSETLFTLDTVYKILFFDFYRLFGELNLERAHGEQEGCPTNDTTVDCPVYNAFVPIILACYMLIANIFLVNFLIAIFNNVIEEVQAEALGRWKYNLLLETEQYACRYILPPPLTLFEMIYHSCKAIFCKQLRSPKTDRATEAKVKSESEEAGKDTEISVGDDEENTNEHLVARELTLSESQEARMQANQAVLNLALIETQKAEQEAERQMEMTRVTKLQQIVEDVLNEAEDSLAALTVPEETVKPEPSTRGLPVKKDEDEEAPPSVEEVQQLLVEFEKQVQALVSLMDRRLWEFIKRSEHTSGENII
ncbi:unnamed protein product [Schistocephalus solidus]|uniref:Ion_trans domain-containing protein n=1 Tax=Schistocephalus solidus TaxID=70667 RepID=A0A183TF31_SCHSO|nr:unnamed protein product [Schistocephalus solidus]